MEKKFKLGVIGAGFMSSAIINGAIAGKKLSPEQIIVSDVNDCALDKMKAIGVNVTKDNSFLSNNAEFVLFAVKPQNINDVLCMINGCCCSKFISIMAGVKKDKIKSILTNAKVARCMPNTPCSIGYGAVGVDILDFDDNDDINFVLNLLSSFAEVVCVEEKYLNAVTGISGSSPAYFYLFLKGIIESGVEHGLNYEEAKRLAASTMIGAGKMVTENWDKTIDELINAVCSKGGTTIEAVNVYNQNNLTDITKRAINACVKRAGELENL